MTGQRVKRAAFLFSPSLPFVRLGRSPRPDGSRRRRRRFSASTSVQYPRRVRRGPYGTTLVRCPLSVERERSATWPGLLHHLTFTVHAAQRQAFVEKRKVHSVPAPPGARTRRPPFLFEPGGDIPPTPRARRLAPPRVTGGEATGRLSKFPS
jgi:hypothetical protein